MKIIAIRDREVLAMLERAARRTEPRTTPTALATSIIRVELRRTDQRSRRNRKDES